jgi:DnaJ-class molecular chaperone
LKNPEKKDLYDKYGIEGVKAGGDPNSNGFFNLF